MFQTRHKQRQG
uniref:Ribosomal protein L36 n=1 Tax=Allium caeruleum TaxID=138318 RepID=A0A6M8TTP0_9ASPA|nr:ribosomal protein L36 [Allium caeruleum]QKJ80472.1 ribosomal protein L36 [Allium caeruleum]